MAKKKVKIIAHGEPGYYFSKIPLGTTLNAELFEEEWNILTGNKRAGVWRVAFRDNQGLFRQLKSMWGDELDPTIDGIYIGASFVEQLDG